MARRRAPAGQRALWVRHAFVLYHGGRISWEALRRVVEQHRR